MCYTDNNPDYSKEQRFSYGYKEKRGWHLDMSDRTQKESDFGVSSGRYQWEETVDVSSEEDE